MRCVLNSHALRLFIHYTLPFFFSLYSICSSATALAYESIPTSIATYSANIKGIPLQASRIVKQKANGDWVIQQMAKSAFGSLKESSTLQISSYVRTLSYQSQLNFLTKQRSYDIAFNYHKQPELFTAKVTDSKKGKYSLESNSLIFSDLSYQLSVRHQLINNPMTKMFKVVVAKNKKQLKRYTFHKGQSRWIQTKLGSIEATPLIYELNGDNAIKLWLAKSYGYVVVAAESIEQGKTVYSLSIETLTVNDKALTTIK